jgi:hypothetical protein
VAAAVRPVRVRSVAVRVAGRGMALSIVVATALVARGVALFPVIAVAVVLAVDVRYVLLLLVADPGRVAVGGAVPDDVIPVGGCVPSLVLAP